MAEIPTGPIDTEPAAPVGEVITAKDNEVMLLDFFDGIELGEYDRDFLSRVAMWDYATVVTFASLIRRARNSNPEQGEVGESDDAPSQIEPARTSESSNQDPSEPTTTVS